jgi:hypothetical protein
MEKLFIDRVFRVLEFCFFFFFFFFFFLPSVAQAGKYSVWSAEGLPSTFGAGGQWAGGQVVASVPAGWKADRQAMSRQQKSGGGGPPVLSVYPVVEKPSMG